MPQMPEFLTSGWWWSQIVTTLVLPPMSLLMLAAWSVWRWNARPQLARIVLGFAVLALWAACTPWVGHQAIDAVVDSTPFDPATLKDFRAEDRPQMIVVLGGGRNNGAIEVGGEDVAARTLLRVRYGARMHRATGLPIAVVGGRPEGGEHSEAELMKATLDGDFGVPVAIVEVASKTTNENAQLSAVLLKQAGLERVLLVTEAWHMHRAREAFKTAGIFAVAAPMGFSAFDPNDPKEFMPTPQGLWMTQVALHELGGQLWYQARWQMRRWLPT